MMRIGKPEQSSHGGNMRSCVSVDWSGSPDKLWYALPETHASFVSDRSDAYLVALLIPAMARGEDIQVDGTISERLYYNLSGAYQHVLKAIIPSLSVVRIEATAFQRGGQPALGVATGFSAGIDSFCALADHLLADVPAGYRLTHLLFNNVAFHGVDGERLFRERYEKIKSLTDRLSLPLIPVNSNLDEFYAQDFEFQQTHTPRNASVPLLLQRGIGRFMYASAFDYAKLFIGRTYDTAYSDLATLPLLSTDTLDAFSVGGECTRVEKTLRVADISLSHDSLDVCVGTARAGNCSRCSKCMRTFFTLEVAGLLDRYERAYDRSIYRRRRPIFVADLLGSKDPLLMEIKAFAAERRFPIPLVSRLLWGTGLAKARLPLRPLWNRLRSHATATVAPVAPGSAPMAPE